MKNGNQAKGGLRHATVGAIAVNENNKVLLVKRARYLLNGEKLAIPGGFLDRDENTQQEALRELKEETGYDGEIISLFRVNDNPNRPKENRQNVDFLFLVKVIGSEPTINKEVTDIVWLDRDKLPPDEEFAFDHRKSILKYFQYQKKKFPLPIIG